MPDKATPLLDLHRDLGAKLTEFGGWDMPLQYEGIVAEHRSVRERSGLFDVSHLGKLLIEGPDGTRALQYALTRDIEAIEPGRATYALALEDDGGCIDDVFVYRLADQRWLLVPNASNVDAVRHAVEAGGASVEDGWDRWAILALQGPDSFSVFAKVFPDTEATTLKLHRFAEMSFGAQTGLVARTGYTGERGFELYVPSAAAVEVFQRLLDEGAAPVGLGARDTLRLEMGYALYGHEIDRDTNPLEAGLGWAVSWDSDFRGRDALRTVKEQGPRRQLFGIRLEERGVPRQGYPVLFEGEEVGEVVSGNHSPTLGTGIAMAYAPVEKVPPTDAEVSVEARNRHLRGVRVDPPFITRT